MPTLESEGMDGLSDLDGWLRLSLTPGVGSVSARRLLSAFGLPEQVFLQPAAALRQVVGEAQVQALLQVPPDWASQCQSTRDWLAGAENRCVISLADPGYPAELLHMSDPPLLLYLQGEAGLLAHPQRLAVVGSRNPTPQGELNARDMSRALAAAGVCIVSGMALGVDGAAHLGALEAGGATVAVVGTGLDRVYPRRHLELAHRIAQSGLLVSEFVLGTPPNPSNFPKRNRIIAGLSQGTLVVEAALASGSLITAKLAADLGREVFAIPGSIHSPQAKGCHALIRQGAKLVETAQDVLEDMRLASPSGALRLPLGEAATPDDPFADGDVGSASDAHAPLLDKMGLDPVSLDVLQARTGFPTANLQALLMELELDGCVARVPGGLFQRLVRA